MSERAHLEPLILQNLLDGDILAILWCRNNPCLEDDTEGAITDDFAMAIRYLPMITCFTIGSNDLDDFRGIVNSYGRKGQMTSDSKGRDRPEKNQKINGTRNVKRHTRCLDAVYRSVGGHFEEDIRVMGDGEK